MQICIPDDKPPPPGCMSTLGLVRGLGSGGNCVFSRGGLDQAELQIDCSLVGDCYCADDRLSCVSQ